MGTSNDWQAGLTPDQAESSRHVRAVTHRRGVRTLQSRQRSLPVLFVTMLLTIVAIVAAAYFGARASALNTAQERLGQDAQIASEMVAERGQYASLQGDKLVVGVGNATYTLTNDTYVVDHIQDVTGDQAIIYRLDGTRLLSVASTFSAPGSAGNGTTNTSARQVGDVLTGPARDAILGHCPPSATGSACRGRFSGVMTLRGQSMMAAFVPLLDINGKLVGAVGVARPLDAVLQPPTQLVIVLAFVGLLVTLISLGIGTWILGVRGDQAIAELGQRLEAMARSATEVRQLVQLQSGRLQRQERAVRQVSELARELDPLVGTMEREQVSLRQSATDIWAEMSQPGVAPNPATALQLARASAVAAARVGATGEEVRARSRHLLGLLNQVIAEGHALTEEGQEAAQHAGELLATIEGVERTLGDHTTERRHELPSLPFMRRGAARRPETPRQGVAPAKPTGAPTVDQRTDSSQYAAASSSGRNRAPRGQAGQHRLSPGQQRKSAIHPLYESDQRSGIHPKPGNSPQQPPNGGQRNGGHPGPGRPPQARPPKADDSQPGRNSSDSRWLND